MSTIASTFWRSSISTAARSEGGIRVDHARHAHGVPGLARRLVEVEGGATTARSRAGPP